MLLHFLSLKTWNPQTRWARRMLTVKTVKMLMTMCNSYKVKWKRNFLLVRNKERNSNSNYQFQHVCMEGLRIRQAKIFFDIIEDLNDWTVTCDAPTFDTSPNRMSVIGMLQYQAYCRTSNLSSVITSFGNRVIRAIGGRSRAVRNVVLENPS